MKKLNRSTIALLLIVGLTLSLGVACEREEGPAEELGESIDDVVDDLKDRGDDLGDKLEDAKDEIEEGVEEAKDKLDDDGNG